MITLTVRFTLWLNLLIKPLAKLLDTIQGLTNATRVGRDNVVGRANQARRLKNVEKTASIVPYSGSIRVALSQAYDVGVLEWRPDDDAVVASSWC